MKDQFWICNDEYKMFVEYCMVSNTPYKVVKRKELSDILVVVRMDTTDYRRVKSIMEELSNELVK